MRKQLFVTSVGIILAASCLHAQTLTPIYEYTVLGTNGANLAGNLIQASDGNLYGVSLFGGAQNTGNVFRVTPSGAYTDIYDCSTAGTDCNQPISIMQLSDGNLWIVSALGGASGVGNIFSLSLGGTYLKDWIDFSKAGPSFPNGHAIYDAKTDSIFGTTQGSNAALSTITGYADPYGSVYQFQTGLETGFYTLVAAHYFNITDANGFQPIDGLTDVNNTIYMVNQLGGSGKFGTLLASSTLSDPALQFTVLHSFADGTDGAYPTGAPQYDGPSGFLYGTTAGGASGSTNQGTVWKAGLTSGFTTLGEISGAAGTNPGFSTPVTFDSGGNMIFSGPFLQNLNTGETAVGGFYFEKQAGGTPDEFYSFTEASDYGDHPYSAPFFDQTGAMWTQEFGGGNVNGTAEGYGTVDKWSLSTQTRSPITISLSAQQVTPNTNFTISWTATNRFSQNEQQCYGFQGNFSGKNAWSGPQTGTYTQTTGFLTGSQTISYTATGDYPIAILCGWTQAANTVVHVRIPSKTTVSVLPTSVPEGGSVTFSVGVSGNASAPTGTVTLSTIANTIGSIPLSNGSGTTTASTAGISPGTYTVVASYPGDTQYAASTASTTLTITAGNKVNTTTTVTATPVIVAMGNNETISATVTKQSGSGVPTGSVTFSVSGQSLGTVQLNSSGVATATTAAKVPVGNYTVLATYSGDNSDFTSSGSTSVSVRNGTSTSLGIAPTTITQGNNAQVNIVVSSSSGTPTGSATLYASGSNLGTVNLSGGSVTFPISTAKYPKGTYSVTAVYNGDSTHVSSTSNAVTVTVN